MSMSNFDRMKPKSQRLKIKRQPKLDHPWRTTITAETYSTSRRVADPSDDAMLSDGCYHTPSRSTDY